MRAKAYAYLKYSLALLDILYTLILLLLFAASGLSSLLSQRLLSLGLSNYQVIPAYVSIVFLAYALFNLPFNFIQSFVLEHKFSLSNQKLGNWLSEHLKSLGLSLLFSLVLAFAFYYILFQFTAMWWLAISLFWIFFHLVIARLTPILVIPLFFKYKRLEDETLRGRIMRLAEKMSVGILDCFEIDFSKKTTKANAAFVGLGKSKRVILADTLKDKYSYDEIEVVLAHEFAHYKMRHLIKLILINSGAVLACFYLISVTQNYALGLFGMNSLRDIASLPVVLLYFMIMDIILTPLQNYTSRRLERDADIAALKNTGLKTAFISLMQKLADQNLSDRDPHPLIKFYFFDHPPANERIALAEAYK